MMKTAPRGAVFLWLAFGFALSNRFIRFRECVYPAAAPPRPCGAEAKSRRCPPSLLRQVLRVRCGMRLRRMVYLCGVVCRVTALLAYRAQARSYSLEGGHRRLSSPMRWRDGRARILCRHALAGSHPVADSLRDIAAGPACLAKHVAHRIGSYGRYRDRMNGRAGLV